MVHITIQYRDTGIVFKLHKTNVATVSRFLLYTIQYCFLITVRFKSVREQFDICTALDAAKDPALSSLDIPLLRIELILMHPFDTIKTKHEHKEKDRLQEYAVGDVRVSENDVYVDDMDEGGAARVLLTFLNTFLVQNKGAPYAESE